MSQHHILVIEGVDVLHHEVVAASIGDVDPQHGEVAPEVPFHNARPGQLVLLLELNSIFRGDVFIRRVVPGPLA